MRLEDLAVRLVALEAKVSSLTGYGANPDIATSLEELNARLGLLECTVEMLVTNKTQEHIDAIVAASADEASVKIADVIELSPSINMPEAATIVADVVAEQHANDEILDIQIADIVSAAVMAVVTAEPEVVVDPVAITESIISAVTDAPLPTSAPAPEVVQQIVDAVVDIIATATGVDTVAPEVVQQVVEAVATPADPALDAIESRLNVVESKVDSLLGK